MRLYKRLISALCVLFVIISFVCMAFPVEAASGPTITTTLTDNIVQRGSKKTFDVWARNSADEKIKVTVKLNGQTVDPTWDDNDKTSYTLSFTKEGENIVTVSASSNGGRKKELTYHITYQKAASGDVIGSATWSVELFTIGCGYLVYPVEMPIYEGETAAEQLIRLLHNNGFVGYYSGTLKSSFYIGYIADGTASGAKYNNYTKSGTPQSPKKLNLSPSVPSLLVPYLEDTMTFFDPQDYTKSWAGYIGEFVFTNGSGWMYSVNNNFPNVGFADAFLSDGDVVRMQFTLAYGADIGGLGSVGSSNVPGIDNQPESGFFTVADKDELSKTICRALSSGLMSRDNVKSAYETALTVMKTLNASQSSVNNAVSGLSSALANPSKDTGAVPPETPPSTGGSSGPDNSGNTGGSSGSGNSDSTGGSSDSGHSTGTSKSSGANAAESNSGSTDTSGNSVSDGSPDTSSSSNDTEESSHIPDETESGKKTDSSDHSASVLETSETENSNALNGDIENEKKDDNEEKGPSMTPFVIAGVSVLVVVGIAAVIIAIYIHKKKVTAAEGSDAEGTGEDE